MLDKFFKASFWYNFFTNTFYRVFTILFVVGIFVWGYYSWFYNKDNQGDIKIKASVDTSSLYGKEVMEYMQDNGFRFMSGNPVYATNFTLVDDGVDFRRYKDDDGTIEYQYCNSNVYPTCVNSDITIEELPTLYNSESSSYDRIVGIYTDYQEKLGQLKLTHEQIKSALDYHYQELYEKN